MPASLPKHGTTTQHTLTSPASRSSVMWPPLLPTADDVHPLSPPKSYSSLRNDIVHGHVEQRSAESVRTASSAEHLRQNVALMLCRACKWNGSIGCYVWPSCAFKRQTGLQARAFLLCTGRFVKRKPSTFRHCQSIETGTDASKTCADEQPQRGGMSGKKANGGICSTQASCQESSVTDCPCYIPPADRPCDVMRQNFMADCFHMLTRTGLRDYRRRLPPRRHPRRTAPHPHPTHDAGPMAGDAPTVLHGNRKCFDTPASTA